MCWVSSAHGSIPPFGLLHLRSTGAAFHFGIWAVISRVILISCTELFCGEKADISFNWPAEDERELHRESSEEQFNSFEPSVVPQIYSHIKFNNLAQQLQSLTSPVPSHTCGAVCVLW